MEKNGIYTSYDIETARQKSSSLPNRAKLSIVNPFADYLEASPAENSMDDYREDRTGKTKEKNRRFNFFWKSKPQSRRSDESDSSSSLSSSSNSTPKRGGLLNFAKRCAKKNKSNGDEAGDNQKSGEYTAPTSSRLSQSSRDLRETRKDALSAFDLFASCKRSPSLLDSLDSYGRKGKRHAIKARVEAQRQQYKDTSSDEEEQWHAVKKYHSDEAIHKSSKESRARVARTQRFYKRKTREELENGKADDKPPLLEKARAPQNFRSWSSRASKSPSPQLQGALQSHFVCNVQGAAPNEDGRHLNRSVFSRPPKNYKSHEEHENVMTCHLPIRKVCVDGIIPRAPTPPPRSSTKFHLVSVDGKSRPQSYAFESFPSPGRASGTQTGSETEGNNVILNGYSASRQPLGVSSDSSSRAARPLSFTTTSHVFYNHAPLLGEGYERVSYSSNDGTCMSDSQISGKGKGHRRSSIQLGDLNILKRNFNSVPKPWSPVPSGCGADMQSSSHKRPPPSPTRHMDAFVFTSGKATVNCDLASPKPQRFQQLEPQKSRAGTRHPLSEAPNAPRRNPSSQSQRNRPSSPPPPPTRRHFRQTKSTNLEAAGRKLDKLMKSGKGKSTDNLEDALLELERIYESMKIDDEAYAAETNDPKVRRNSTSGDINPKQGDSLSKTPIMGSYDSLTCLGNSGPGTPDVVTDDLAYRKQARGAEGNRPASAYLGATGSYLMRSPALSPTISMDDIQSKVQSEPNTILDDLSFRNIRDANLQKVIEPQPPFGIPLGPVSQAASTDYLHAQAKDLSRPKMRRRFTPDVVKDDLAYRNLRRDKKDGEGTRPETVPSNPDFHELDNILTDELQVTAAANRKKYRAVRSLSANISHLISKSGAGNLSVPLAETSEMEKSQSLTNLTKIVDGADGHVQQSRTSSSDSVRLAARKATGSAQERTSDQDASKVSNSSNGQRKSRSAQQSKCNETSSSTETLTDAIPKPPNHQPLASPSGDQGSGNDIWQVRVTLGSVNLGSVNPEESKVRQSPRLLRPIPVKLEVPKSDCKFSRGVPYTPKRIAVPHFGYVSDSDAHCKHKGLPIDERQLDDLLNSLAQGARPDPVTTSLVQRTSVSCPQSPDNPNFPTVFTDNATGEISVKLVFPGLKVAGVKTAEQNGDSSAAKQVTTEGNRAINLANIEGASERGLKTSTNSSYGVTCSRRRDKEMFPLATRTRSMVTSSPTTDRSLHEKTISNIGFCNVGDGYKLTDRPPVIRRVLGTCNADADENRLAGGPNDESNKHETGKNADRIARYKEERRKQLASQYGQWSSSGEEAPNLGEEPSYMRYSRRYKKRNAENGAQGNIEVSCNDTYNCNSGDPATMPDCHNNQPLTDVTSKDFLSRNQDGRGSLRESPTKPLDGVQSPVRSNRASRLRARANGSTNVENVVGITTDFSRQGSFRSRLPIGFTSQRSPSTPDALLGRSFSLNQGATPVSSSSEAPGGHGASGNATTESESGGTGSDIRSRPKDKSSKRKSNLNRMGAVDSTPVPSDSGDDNPRRFRRTRHTPGESGTPPVDGIQSDSLKSVGIVQSIQHHFSSGSTAQNKLDSCKDNTCRKNGKSRDSADCQIKCRSLYVEDETSDSDFDRGGSLRRSGRTALRRPKIPDIFQKKNTLSSETCSGDKKATGDRIFDDTLLTNHKIYETTHSKNISIETKGLCGNSNKILSDQVDELEAHRLFKDPFLLSNNEEEKPRWELTKIPIRKATLSILDNIPNSGYCRNLPLRSNGHTLKINVGQTSNGIADDNVSDTLKELTKLVRETTARVDCLTNAALNVEVDRANTKTMGNRLLRGSSAPETNEPETFYTQVSVSTKTTDTSFYPKSSDKESSIVQNGKYLIRSDSQYAPDGNWQLGKSPAEGKNSAVASAPRKFDIASDNYSDNNDVKVPNRISTAYHGGSENKKSCSFADPNSNSAVPASPPAWRKVGDTSILNLEAARERIERLESQRRSSKSESEVPTHEAFVEDGGSAPSILKKKSFDEGESFTRSILKHKDDAKVVEGRPPVPHSILKRGSFDDASRSHSPEKSSILKKRESSEDSDHRCSSPEVVSILRRRSAEEAEDRYSNDRYSILRRKSMLDEAEHNRSILKKQYSSEVLEMSHADPRPILKKKSSSEDLEQSEPRPILKKRSSTEEEWDDRPKPILKGRRRSGPEDVMENEVADVTEARRSVRVMASSPILRVHQQDDAASSPARHLSSGRHATTSSEEEFVSLPPSPDNWSLRRNSQDECFSKSVKAHEDRNAVVNNNRNGKEAVGKCSAPLNFAEVKAWAEESGANVDTSEDEDDSSSSSASSTSSEEENTQGNATAPATRVGDLVTVDTGIQFAKARNGESDGLRAEPANVKASEVTNRASVQTFSGLSITKSFEKKPEVSSILNVRFVNDPKKVEITDLAMKDKRRSLPVARAVEATNVNVSCHISGTTKERSASVDNESEGEEDVVRMSVAARASLIMEKIQQQQSPKPIAVRRFVNRRCLQRSQTQPVTVEEVQEAAKIAEDSVRRQQSVDESGKSGSDLETVKESAQKETSESEEDPSKLSLAERVKLFNQKMVEERLPARKLSNGAVPPLSEPPRRRRVVSTRFRTQPVTSEEVEKAQRISPLATSLTRPPEPEILGTLPVRLACDLMHKRGEEVLSQKITNATVTSSSTDTSRSDDGADSRPKSILKNKSDIQMVKMEVKSSVSETTSKSRTTNAVEVKNTVMGILKSEKSSSYSEHKPILKESAVWQPPIFGKPRPTPMLEESSSSSSDEENESEGITISMRDASPSQRITSTDDDSSSTSHSAANHETRRIKNEAVLRRRNASLRKLEERKNAELLHSQSLSVESSFICQSNVLAAVLAEHSATRNVRTVTQRSSTQPIVRMEKADVDGVVEESRGSIAERLAALQSSQQQDWKKRLARTKSLDDQEIEVKSMISDSKVIGVPGDDDTPSKILQKVSSLEVSQLGWRKRIEEKDAIKFTVAGKMGKISPPLESPLLDRKKRTPKPVRFQSRTANLLELAKSSPSTPVAPQASPISRSKSMPMPHLGKVSPDDENPTKVVIPKADDGFCSFFESVSFDKLQSQKIDVRDDAFDAITSESRQLLVQRRSVHVVRRHAGTKNPLKTLAARQDLLEEYTEVKTGVAERELKRIKVEQLAKHSDLATSALAGLASTEDFKSVSLRKSSSMINVQLLPYKDLMLLLVKGRRHVQCRLVEPTLASLNKGDNFILVTPAEVYNWIGAFSNVIERAKGAEIASVIQTKRDLGFKGSEEVVTFDEEKHTGGRGRRRDFFHHLGGEDAIAESGDPEEDEIYEAAIVDTNKVYNVEGDELVPYEKYWGCLPKVDMLEKDKVLVFDFGSEMYVWQGKLAPNDLRKKAVKLAQELWGEGYDYTECDINPLNPYRNGVTLSFGKQRPPWALFAKVNQHMETILFRSKFLDWPDMERIIRVKRQDSEAKSEGSIDLQPCDAQAMLETMAKEPDLVLENSHLGRGLYYWEELERRHCDIATLGIKVWHVLEYNHSILPLESWGQFHSGDTYVVRWQYRVTVAGRDLSGQVSKHSYLGRERCAYFFWQGCHSTINEKGASALMTVELDEERGPHVRVVQGQEPPCFLNLFQGSMAVHLGKREDEGPIARWRLFVVRGELENEAHIVEVACNANSLRSYAAFILVNSEDCLAFLWFGAKIKDHVKEVAKSAFDIVEGRKPLEFGFKIGVPVTAREEQEGHESEKFLEGLGGKSECDSSLAKHDVPTPTCTPRLFYLSSVSGVFTATEITCSFWTKDRVSCYPFLQSDLYKAAQPALFLLDCDTEVYLWQGWWPEATDDNDNTSTGSAHLRFNVERRLAMETVVQYCATKRSDNPPVAHAIWAGLEPPEFKLLFPEWEERADVVELNLREGRKAGEKKLVKDVLVQLKRTRYTFAELQERPLPEGVDPSILESYLRSEEFLEVLKMSKKDFYALPSWKQYNLKKVAGLY